jgi:hypothetical protein
MQKASLCPSIQHQADFISGEHVHTAFSPFKPQYSFGWSNEPRAESDWSLQLLTLETELEHSANFLNVIPDAHRSPFLFHRSLQVGKVVWTDVFSQAGFPELSNRKSAVSL